MSKQTALEEKFIIFLLNKVLLEGLIKFEQGPSGFKLEYAKKAGEKIEVTGPNPCPIIPIHSYFIRDQKVEGKITQKGIEEIEGLSVEHRKWVSSWLSWSKFETVEWKIAITAFFKDELQHKQNCEYVTTTEISACSFAQFRASLLRWRPNSIG